MDVEDPINPLADNAALDFPILFANVGVRGSFCLTGEKCKTLTARGRQDVAEAYRPHCLGLHTNGHSFHPTTMELLAELSYDEGCEAALAEETKGYDAFKSLVGRSPAFWGGGGNTWSPEIIDALKRLQIPAYVYAQTELPDNAIHRFNGVLALPQALSISELDWADDERAAIAGDRVLGRIAQIDQPWLGLFVGHPTKFRYLEYWDRPYYFGRTPPGPEYTEPVDQETYDRAKSNLRDFLIRLKEAFPIVGVDDVVQMKWLFRQPTVEEMSYFTKHTYDNLVGAAGWPPHRKGLDTSFIAEKTIALKHTLEVAVLE